MSPVTPVQGRKRPICEAGSTSPETPGQGRKGPITKTLKSAVQTAKDADNLSSDDCWEDGEASVLSVDDKGHSSDDAIKKMVSGEQENMASGKEEFKRMEIGEQENRTSGE